MCIFFSLLSGLTWAATNVVDKYLLAKWIRQPGLVTMGFGIVGLATALTIFLFRGFGHLPWSYALIAVVAGMIYLLAEYFYYKGAQLEEISRVISLIYLDPLFTAVFSAIFIGEIFSVQKYIGVFLLVIGAVIIAYRKSSGFGFRSRQVIWFCVFAALLYGV